MLRLVRGAVRAVRSCGERGGLSRACRRSSRAAAASSFGGSVGARNSAGCERIQTIEKGKKGVRPVQAGKQHRRGQAEGRTCRASGPFRAVSARHGRFRALKQKECRCVSNHFRVRYPCDESGSKQQNPAGLGMNELQRVAYAQVVQTTSRGKEGKEVQAFRYLARRRTWTVESGGRDGDLVRRSE
jgi:hypothetical protein